MLLCLPHPLPPSHSCCRPNLPTQTAPPHPSCLWPCPQELVCHPFWKQPLQLLELPPEPAFDAFVRQHDLVPCGAAAQDKVGGCRRKQGVAWGGGLGAKAQSNRG
jgi:hypothetical protein